MCLSTVYTYCEDPTETEEICSSISSYEVDGSSIIFTDLLGDEYAVEGTVTKVDFVKSKIFVAVAG